MEDKDKLSGKPPKNTGAEKKQKRLIKKKRAGVELSEDEVKAIKQGRKKLRKEMKAQGIKTRREFELTAGTLGLYFDKNTSFFPWLLSHWLGALIASMIAFMAVLLLFLAVQYMRGRYTISVSEEMFQDGFTLSDNAEFTNPTTQLFASPAEYVPCVSIAQIPEDIDEIDGEHSDVYFAYTYYIRNEGENTVDYTWVLNINAESLELSKGAWILVFEDGEPTIYASPNTKTGNEEALPDYSDDTRGYSNLPLQELAPDSDQFEPVATVGNRTYWRVIPKKFHTEKVITGGNQKGVAPMEVHKYTVVMWLEGDDPDTTDELIGGHMGVEMNFRLDSEAEKNEEEGALRAFWEKFFGGLKFL